MNSIALPTSNPLTEWLLFLAILVPLRLAIVGLVAWLLAVHNQGKKRQKGRRHQASTFRLPSLATVEVVVGVMDEEVETVDEDVKAVDEEVAAAALAL